jgi:hypothetical protein
MCSVIGVSVLMDSFRTLLLCIRCWAFPQCMITELTVALFVQPDTVTGDIVFVLQLKEHPKFKRKGDDLFVEHTLSLTEALCGFQFPLTHLDGRQLLIKSNPGEIVKPGSFLHSSTYTLCFYV